MEVAPAGALQLEACVLNVLFITADQWRADCMSAAGHPVLRTPNIDALAAAGVLFGRHYAQAAPCAPARACLYTGLYQMTNRVCRNGTPLDRRHDTIALAARRAGYEPTLFGYTDVGADPRAHDPADPALFTYEGILPGMAVRAELLENLRPWLSWLASRGVAVPGERPFDVFLPADGPADPPSDAPARYDRQQTMTAYLTDELLRWLGEPRDRPFFAHLSWLRPHPPFIATAPYNDWFRSEDGPAFRRAGDRDAEAAQHPYLAHWLATQKKSHFRYGARGLAANWSEEDAHRLRQAYWGLIAEVDHELGRVIAALRRSGLWDNTLIVLTTDHGEMMGDHHLFGKGGYFEESFRVPLIVRDPRRPTTHGTRVDAFSEAVDVMPTILEALDQPVPHQLDGRSLVPFLDGAPPRDWRRAAHWEFDFRAVATGSTQRALALPVDACNLAVQRGERYKYVHFAGLPPLLFDLEDDPNELHDRADDPACRDIRLACAEELLSWRATNFDRALSHTELTTKGPVHSIG